MIRDKPDRNVYDPIHGHYSLPRELWNFIDTPVYQRLRDLKQLGTTHYVFPGGNHSRFEHCLGVGHLSRKYLRSLQKKQPELDITSNDIRNVTLAGLMHDLGHGPFSHIFDSDIVPALGIPNWSHEQASVDLFRYMVNTYALDLQPEDFTKVSNMILGEGTGFMYQIVNNKLNSIDVDKFDYIERDCHCLGFREFPFDTQRMMKRSIVIDNIICFDEKIVHSIYSMFQSRFNLFQQCYSHRVGQAVGLMIKDVLVEANQHINLIERVQDPSKYYKLTDSVVSEIFNSSDPALARAQEIIRKIQCRELYTQAGQLIFSQETPHQHITAERIASYSSGEGELLPSDLVVKEFKLTYGNPADQVWFYNEFHEMKKIPKEKVSSLLPAGYCDRFLRVFAKTPDKLVAAKKAFREFSKREFNE